MKDNDKKRIIMKAASNKFAKFGFLKTTVDEIAKSARIGKASIYHYFKSKETLFKEVVEQENNFLREKLQESIKQEPTPQKKMRTYILNRMKYLKEMSNIHSALKDEYLEHYAFIEKLREKNTLEELKSIKNILINGENSEIFDIKDIELTAFAIVSALKGLEHPWSIEIPIPEIESNVDKLLEILFFGIMKR